MKRGTSRNAKSQAKRARARKQQSQGSSAYMAAVRGTGCILARVGTPGGPKPCDGPIEFSHLEKSGHEDHHWTRAVAKCRQHHMEYEGRRDWWCQRYGIAFIVLLIDSERNVQQFGHLVPKGAR